MPQSTIFPIGRPRLAWRRPTQARRFATPVTLGLAVALSVYLPTTAALADAVADCQKPPNPARRIEACNEVIQSGKLAGRDLSLVFLRRGIGQHDSKNYDAALQDYQTALALDATNAVALAERGVTRAAKGDLDGALNDYDEAIPKLKNPANAHYNRGNLWLRRGDRDRARADYDTALTLNPNHAGAKSRLASLSAGAQPAAKPVSPPQAAPSLAFAAAQAQCNAESPPDVLIASCSTVLADTTAAPIDRLARLQARSLGYVAIAKLDLALADSEAAVKIFNAATVKMEVADRLKVAAATLGQRGLIKSYISFEDGLGDIEEALLALKNRPDLLDDSLRDVGIVFFRTRGLNYFARGDKAKALAMFERQRALDPKDENNTALWIAAAQAGTIKIDGRDFIATGKVGAKVLQQKFTMNFYNPAVKAK